MIKTLNLKEQFTQSEYVFIFEWHRTKTYNSSYKKIV